MGLYGRQVCLTLIGTNLGGRRRRRGKRGNVQCLPDRSKDKLPLSLRESSRVGGQMTLTQSLSQRALLMFIFSLFKPVLSSHCVCCPRLFVEREVSQCVMFIRLQNSEQKIGKNGNNKILCLPDHCQQVPISQQGLTVPLTGRNEK